MINLERLKADREAGVVGPWRVTDDGGWLEPVGGSYVDGKYLSICVTATSEADKSRIARLPELEAAYIEAAKLLEEAKWCVQKKLFDAIEDLIGRSD